MSEDLIKGEIGDEITLQDRRKPGRMPQISPTLASLLRREEREALLKADRKHLAPSDELLHTGERSDNKGSPRLPDIMSEDVFAKSNPEFRDAHGIILGVVIGAVTWVAVALILYSTLHI